MSDLLNRAYMIDSISINTMMLIMLWFFPSGMAVIFINEIVLNFTTKHINHFNSFFYST